MDYMPLFDGPQVRQRRTLSVSQLTGLIKQTLEEAFPPLWVSGEVSDVSRPQSGHVYFTLKDAHAQIRAVMWRSSAQRMAFELRDGQEILCLSQLDVYPPRGGYQLVVRQIEPLGLGAQQLALRQLKERLAREGLFDPARKRSLPRFPRRVGLVTSPSGAAVRDFLEVLRRRWSGVDVLVFPVRMQGETVPREVTGALAEAARLRQPLDVIVLARGGGSIEDLVGFNDERVVRAIASCPIPVVTAIGHEIDVTLADLAADLRALTPTEAAEHVVPSRLEMRQELEGLEHRLRQRLLWRMQHARQRLARLAERPVLTRPFDHLRHLTRAVDELQLRLHHVMGTQTRAARQRLDALAARLHSLSPLAVLSRGYSLTQTLDGTLVRDARQLQPNQPIVTRLARGAVECLVQKTIDDTDSQAPQMDSSRSDKANAADSKIAQDG